VLFNIRKARQAKSISLYKNLRTKVMKCCANIYFNRQSLIKSVILYYAKIKFLSIFPATNIPQKQVQTIQINDEIKFLYMKKEKLNNDLYKMHLKIHSIDRLKK
jgi:hypothetical protein